MARHVHQLSGDVYRNTDPIPEDTPKIQGYNFNQGVDHRALLQSYLTTGLQATNVGFGYPADQQHGEMGGTQGEFRWRPMFHLLLLKCVLARILQVG